MALRTIEFSMQLSPETDERIQKLCISGGMTRNDLINKSLALMEIALKNKEEGNHLVIADRQGNKITEIVGL